MPSASRNDTERDSGLKIVNQNIVTIQVKVQSFCKPSKKKWNRIFIRTLSVTQRENVMKELIRKSFIEKQCKTCQVKHTYQTVGVVNVQELNKKIRSVVMPSELRRFFNKKNDFLNIFGSDDVLLNLVYTQCLLCNSLISLSKFNSVNTLSDEYIKHIKLAHAEDKEDVFKAGKLSLGMITIKFY